MQKATLKQFKKLAGFAKYVTLESEIIHNVVEKVEDEEDFFSRRQKRIARGESLHENAGPAVFFSFAEAVHLYNNAETTYGKENISQARHLIREAINKGCRKQYAKAPIVEDIQALRERYPNFGEAIDQIASATALAQLGDLDKFEMKPLLLLGPAGVGKTAFCQSVAKILSAPFQRIDLAQLTTNAILAGLSLSWSTGTPGEIFKFMSTSDVINPVLLLDEIDKIGGYQHHSIEPTLLTLLESESSKNFKDEALKLAINCQHLVVFATANHIEKISNPLLSRFDVVQVQPPNQQEIRIIINNIYLDYLNSQKWGMFFSQSLDQQVIQKLLPYSPRRIKAIIQSALGRAALRGAREIQENDVHVLEYLDESKKAKIGFI
jgi:DNA polymerase III delta prime subunit